MGRILMVFAVVVIAGSLVLTQSQTSGGTSGGTGATGTRATTGATAPTGAPAGPTATPPVAAPSGIGGDPTRQPAGGVNQSTAPTSITPPANQPPLNTSTGGGIVTPNSPTGPTTPIVTLGTTSSNPAGASNATPGNQAGATNSTLQPTVGGGVASQSVFTTPVIENLPNSANFGTTSSASNFSPDNRDLAIGGSDSAWSISPSTLSVAEASRKARSVRAGRKSRVFTNADIARLRGEAPVSVVGNAGNVPVTNERTMPASDVVGQPGPTTPLAPPAVQPPATQNPPAQQPKSPFAPKPSPQIQPR